MQSVSLIFYKKLFGWVPEWPKGADCKSASNAFGGSNPPPPIARELSESEPKAKLELSRRHVDALNECEQREHEFSNRLARELIIYYFIAGWSSPEARWAHNPKVVGSNPTPAIS